MYLTSHALTVAPHQLGALGDIPESGVPEVLEPVLFPVDEDGGASFAILDGAKVEGLPEMLAASGLEHDSLFNGQAFADYAETGPWIVALTSGNAFVKHLFTSDKNNAPWCLWDRSPGILLRSNADLETLRAHFRRFTKVQDEKGAWTYFRFYEDWVVSSYLDAVADMPDRLKAFMITRQDHWITLCTRAAQIATTPALRNASVAPARPVIDAPVRAAFVAGRWQRFLDRLVAVIEADDTLPVETIAADVRGVAQVARDRGYTSEQAIYNTVRAWLLLQGGTTKLLDIEKEADRHGRLTPAERARYMHDRARALFDTPEAAHA